MLVYEIARHNKASDLLVKTTEKDKAYNYEKQYILRALELGKNVILNGSLSAELYQALLPLLANPPRFFSNGCFLPEPGKPFGRLYVVMPPVAPEFTFVSSTMCCDYHLNDYDHLMQEQKTDFPDRVKILQFLEKAQHISCTQGQLLTYDLIQWMQRRLQETKLHPHNPVKGRTTYRYEKGSEEYAYINILGKYYFAEKDAMPPRYDKIQR